MAVEIDNRCPECNCLDVLDISSVACAGTEAELQCRNCGESLVIETDDNEWQIPAISMLLTMYLERSLGG